MTKCMLGRCGWSFCWLGGANAQCRATRVPCSCRRPYEKERLDQEMKLLGEYGLRCKREIWRAQLALAKVRSAARKVSLVCRLAR